MKVQVRGSVRRTGVRDAACAMSDEPDLTVVLVSYNTRALTLRCLETLFDQTRAVRARVVVWDNASADGSADAVAAAFPQVELIRSAENLGFARANNAVAETVTTPWLLLLNTDTEVLDRAIDRLMAFAEANPDHGIYGGRTVFPDGSLNIASCWNRITPWSAFCQATGLTALFRRTALFDPEALGGWQRDSVREVDIVVGCFMLVRTELWRRLGGFDPAFWMYGEEADLCLRARAMGFRPVVTPEATIVHLVGASTSVPARKTVLLAKARRTLMDRHWSAPWRPLARPLMWLWAASRRAGTGLLAGLGLGKPDSREKWAVVWAARADWLAGY
jgi:GT2 family glycosyltransferase